MLRATCQRKDEVLQYACALSQISALPSGSHWGKSPAEYFGMHREAGTASAMVA